MPKICCVFDKGANVMLAIISFAYIVTSGFVGGGGCFITPRNKRHNSDFGLCDLLPATGAVSSVGKYAQKNNANL